MDASGLGARRLGWLLAAGAAYACLVVLPWITPFGPLPGEPAGVAASAIVTVVPGLLLLAASRREILLPRLRLALLLLGVSILLVAGGNLLRFIASLGISLPAFPGLALGSTIIIWTLGLAALILIPLTPLAPGGRWRLATDIVVTVVGMSFAVFAIWTSPGMRLAPEGAHARLIAYNSMEAANLVVLNLILVRGPARPVRRAIWCLASTVAIETVYLIALEYTLGRRSHDFTLSNSLFFLDYLTFACAAASFLFDTPAETDVPLLPEGLRAFNPLPVVAVLGIGILLILAAKRPGDPSLLPLAGGLFGLALLLTARVVLATEENLRLLRNEVAEEHRREVEKRELIARMAGGIAHVVNNLMAVVVLRVDMLMRAPRMPEAAAQSLDAIRSAAERASGLAERLRRASGHAVGDSEKAAAIEALSRYRQEATEIAPRRVVTWDLTSGRALIAPSDLETIVRELLSNAVEATAEDGHITIGLHDETSEVPAGGDRFSVLEVRDDGRGIAPGDAQHVFEPFFSTRPFHEGRGLGLSVVHGIVSAYGGRLTLQEAPGGGTRVRVYLPHGGVASGVPSE